MPHPVPTTPPEDLARELGVSREAVDLYRASDVIDLHLDAFIWTRVAGYDLHRAHGHGLFGRSFYSHTDFPRAVEAGLTGAIWSITTNPFKPARWRRDAFLKNLPRLVAEIERSDGALTLVRSAADYRAAREAGSHGAFIGVQGGNALDFDLDDFDRFDATTLIRVTLVHLTDSTLGTTSAPSPFRGSRASLSDRGRAYIERLDEKKILLDLAHISRPGFFEAVDAHDTALPLVVTHTGVDAVHPHWRNVTDAQIRAVADLGGTIGVMLQQSFLGRGAVGPSTVVDHVAHIVELVGEDHASIGSDFDGMIVPPPTLSTPRAYPRLVDEMLRRGWSDTRVRKILGENFLRVVEALRG
ncbi:MAG: membrane dipeptidase [Myxococcales bacterium]|nr:membrane dipeptidase [Myxococcales bacterium]